MNLNPIAQVFVHSILAPILVIAISPSAIAAEFLYVHNTYSGDISKISIPEHEVVATIPIGLYMDYVTPSPDEQILYVNRIETLGIGRAPNIGTSGELIALSTVTDEILWRMELDGMPITWLSRKTENTSSYPITTPGGLPLSMSKSERSSRKYLLGTVRTGHDYRPTASVFMSGQ